MRPSSPLVFSLACLLTSAALAQTPFPARTGIDVPAYRVTDIVHGDWNGDGFEDVATAGNGFLSVLLNDGTGTFLPPTTAACTSVEDFESADINRDGTPDLVLLGDPSTGSRALSIYLNDGLGNFGLSSPVVFANSSLNGADELVLGDVNSDGWVDVVANDFGFSSRGAFEFFVIENQQAAPWFTGVRSVPTPSGAISLRTTALAYVDGDSHLDVIHATDAGISHRINDGTGSFGPVFETPGACSARHIVVADFDGDGREDVAAIPGASSSGCLIGSRDSDLNVFLNRSGSWELRAFDTAQWGAGLAAADLDLDGDTDLVIARRSEIRPSGAPWYSHFALLNGGSGCFDPVGCTAGVVGGGAMPLLSSMEASDVVVADFDGDQRPDPIFVCSQGSCTADLSFWRNDIPVLHPRPGTNDGLELFTATGAPGHALGFTSGPLFSAKTLMPGDRLGVRVRTNSLLLAGAPLILAMTVQSAGLPAPSTPLPGFQLDPTNFIILLNGVSPSPFQFPVATTAGSTFVFQTQTGSLSGQSVYLQTFALPFLAIPTPLPGSAPQDFASTPSHILTFL